MKGIMWKLLFVSNIRFQLDENALAVGQCLQIKGVKSQKTGIAKHLSQGHGKKPCCRLCIWAVGIEN